MRSMELDTSPSGDAHFPRRVMVISPVVGPKSGVSHA